MADEAVTWQDTDAGWDLAVSSLKALSAHKITVGVHGGNVPHAPGDPITKAQLAAVHEFGATIKHPGGTPYKMVGGKAVFCKPGTPGIVGVTQPHEIKIPARSFLRATVDENMPRIEALISGEIDALVAGTRKPLQSAERLGLALQGMVQKRISDGISPPLKASTIRRKGSDKPLVDTGELKSDITFQVKTAGAVPPEAPIGA